MANERLLRQNFISGTITNNPLLAGDTTLNSANLANLIAVTSTSFVKIVLNPLGDTAYSVGPEIVYVTAHTASQTSATIARGKEGTTGIQHATGCPWVVAGLASDLPGSAYGIWTRATNLSIPNATETDITFDAETVDTDGFLTPTSATITVPTGLGGLYSFGLKFTLSASGGASAGMVDVNGTQVENVGLTQGTSVNFGLTGTLLLAAGDTVKFRCLHNNGGALNLNPATLHFVCIARV